MQGDTHHQHSNPKRKPTAQLTPIPLQTHTQSDSDDDDVPLALACKRTHLTANTAGATLPRPETVEPSQSGVALSTDAPLPESHTPTVAVPAITSEPLGGPVAFDAETATPVTVALTGLPVMSVAAAAAADSQYVMSDTAAGNASAAAAAGAGAMSEAGSVQSEPPAVAATVLGALIGSSLVPSAPSAPIETRDAAEAVPSVRVLSLPSTAEAVAGATLQQAPGSILGPLDGNSSAHADRPLDCTTNGMHGKGTEEGVAATPTSPANNSGDLPTMAFTMSSNDAVETAVGAKEGSPPALHMAGASNLTVSSNPRGVVSVAVGHPLNVATNSSSGLGVIIGPEPRADVGLPTASGPVRTPPLAVSVSDPLILPDSEDDPDI